MLPHGCQYYVDPGAPNYNRYIYNAANAGVEVMNAPGTANTICTNAGAWCYRSLSVPVCVQTPPPVPPHTTAMIMGGLSTPDYGFFGCQGLTDLTQAECQAYSTAHLAATGEVCDKSNPTSCWAKGTHPYSSGAWPSLPHGCQYYVDPGATDFNRYVYNIANAGEYEMNTPNNPNSCHRVVGTTTLQVIKQKLKCDSMIYEE